ncbi:DUF6364 family protein [Dyadobacter luticola]|uniref:Uncharacterized protein n=1 Tax=Dyadobacter luticola TaxID=1979387 RepID=A0A5R9L484_9BACT|nr:DUF6364 family protein [Dyadobacter luticola]TLV03085.1 hypothetical protein FEN17_05590 [Dyadobacter luticola]
MRTIYSTDTYKMATKKEPKVKLTLTVKKSVVENAKNYAAQLGISLSQLIEDHLAKLNAKEELKSDKPMSISDQLFGCARGPLSNMTDQEIKDMWVKDKYGL